MSIMTHMHAAAHSQGTTQARHEKYAEGPIGTRVLYNSCTLQTAMDLCQLVWKVQAPEGSGFYRMDSMKLGRSLDTHKEPNEQHMVRRNSLIDDRGSVKGSDVLRVACYSPPAFCVSASAVFRNVEERRR